MYKIHFRAGTAIAALALLLSTTPVEAAERDGIKLPDTQTVDGKTLVLNGIGIREATIFQIDVYFAGLYLEKKTKDAKSIIDGGTKRILMHFVRGVDKDQIAEAYEEGFEKNAGDKLPNLKKKIAQLNSHMADMKEGDKMSLTYVAGKGVYTEVKGKNYGPIEGEDFAKVLFLIFFGEKPPNSDLKEGMLGLLKS